MKLSVALFALLILARLMNAQPTGLTTEVVAELSAAKPDTAYLVREDGSVFATVFVWVRRESTSTTWYILCTDSALTQSRIAHHDAEAASREPGKFDERTRTPENDRILMDIKNRLKRKGQ